MTYKEFRTKYKLYRLSRRRIKRLKSVLSGYFYSVDITIDNERIRDIMKQSAIDDFKKEVK